MPIAKQPGLNLDRNVPALAHHFETTASVLAPAADAFEYLDDPARLTAHLSRSSWMMAGSTMTMETDPASGQSLGSVIRLRGRVLGLTLSVDEVVSERIVPERKVWATIGTPQRLVIGPFRMGFAITDGAATSTVRAWIDYDRPESWPARWLGRLFGKMSARWCTSLMAGDAARQFVSGAERHGARWTRHGAAVTMTTQILEGEMQELTMTISGMHCGGCVNAVRQALRSVPGLRVDAVEVGSARVTYDPAHITVEAIEQAVRHGGFQPATSGATGPAAASCGVRGRSENA